MDFDVRNLIEVGYMQFRMEAITTVLLENMLSPTATTSLMFSESVVLSSAYMLRDASSNT